MSNTRLVELGLSASPSSKFCLITLQPVVMQFLVAAFGRLILTTLIERSELNLLHLVGIVRSSINMCGSSTLAWMLHAGELGT